MPVIDVKALHAEHEKAEKEHKMVEQVNTQRAKAKMKIPKSVIKQFNMSRHAQPSPQPLDPIEPQPQLDPRTEHNIRYGVRSIAITALAQPISTSKRQTLRVGLETNQVITSYIDKRITSSILGWCSGAVEEISFALNYGTEYLRAYNGDVRPSMPATMPAPTPPPYACGHPREVPIVAESLAPTLVPMQESVGNPALSDMEQMSAALLSPPK